MIERAMMWQWLMPMSMGVIGLQVILLSSLLGWTGPAVMQLGMLAAGEAWMIRDVLKRKNEKKNIQR